MKSKEQAEYIEAKAAYEAIIATKNGLMPELTEEILSDDGLLGEFTDTEIRIETELGWHEAWDRVRKAETAVIDWMIRKLEVDAPGDSRLEIVRDAQNIIAQGFESGEKFAEIAIRL